jgi:membrane-bound serine protease (ClpP class)
MFGDFALPGFERPPIETPSLRVNPWVVVAIAVSMFVFLVFVVREMVTARRAAAVGSTTAPRLVGQVGLVTTALDPSGTVRVDSERWSAVSDSGEPIPEGEEVIVTDIEGLTLKVFKAPEGI